MLSYLIILTGLICGSVTNLIALSSQHHLGCLFINEGQHPTSLAEAAACIF